MRARERARERRGEERLREGEARDVTRISPGPLNEVMLRPMLREAKAEGPRGEAGTV